MFKENYVPKTDGFNTQPPEGGWVSQDSLFYILPVSTHSRLKAAGTTLSRFSKKTCCFNTQPPEGGWFIIDSAEAVFNKVSTHSRLKAAGASLKSLAPSGFAAPISLSSQEKREREYNTAFSVTLAFAISLLLKNNPSSPTLPHFHENHRLAIHTINVSLNTSTAGFAPWCSTLRRHLLPRW